MLINQTLADYIRTRTKGGSSRRVKELLKGIESFKWFSPGDVTMMKRGENEPLVASLNMDPFTISFIFSPKKVKAIMFVPEGPCLLNSDIQDKMTFEEFLGACLLMYVKSSEEARKNGMFLPKIAFFGNQALITETGQA